MTRRSGEGEGDEGSPHHVLAVISLIIVSWSLLGRECVHTAGSLLVITVHRGV